MASTGRLADDCSGIDEALGVRGDISFSIHGQLAPVIEILLPPGQSLLADFRSLLSFGETIRTEGSAAGDGTGQRLANAADAGLAQRVILASGEPCTIGAHDLRRYGGRLLVPQPALIAAGPGVSLGLYARFKSLKSAARPNGLELLLAEGSGWLFARSRGDVREITLAPGEVICARVLAISALTATVDIDLLDGSESVDAEGLTLPVHIARLRGPGRVWLQSIPFDDDGPAAVPKPSLIEPPASLEEGRPAERQSG
jgi:uncharacterized protein (AIM24 family)